MSLTASLQELKARFKLSDRMPSVFLGHGSPMNAIDDNEYSQSWSQLGEALPKPQAILVISAHWMTKGTTLVDVSPTPKTIHDFYGFPDALNQKIYPAKGHPELATEVANMLSGFDVKTDNQWGLDHGAWSVLSSLYPEADIPVFQLSIDIKKDLQWHFNIGKELSKLRDRGVLILGSGNIVHNLRTLRFNGKSYDWATEFDAYVKQQLDSRNFQSLIDVNAMGRIMNQANPTLEHYIPAVIIAGTANSEDELSYLMEGIDHGSISMRSFTFHNA